MAWKLTPRSLGALHGAYLLFGGLWPMLHMASFEAVTGPKSDHWLVRSVGGILIVVGATLFAEARRSSWSKGVVLIAMGVSFVLGVVAVVTSILGRIWPVYLLDAALHLAFVAAWTILLRSRAER
ncbi:MAG TPA: hypothetical protein VHL57_03190 [Flavobacteriales bacterium]|jgi:hypothetical protein|nr:hypothetical protein [Flavobacteriales bacterium]